MRLRYGVILFILVLQCASGAPPVNDLVSDRIPLPSKVPVSVTGRLTGATRELSEPNLQGQYRYRPQASIWWSWIAPSTGWFDISSFGRNPLQMTTSTNVYTGSRVDALRTVGLSATRLLGSGAPEARSIQFIATAGTEYQIRVSSLSSSVEEEVQLTVESIPSLGSNDNFADRINLGNARNVSMPGNFLGATMEPGEPAAHRGQSVWYEWTAPDDSLVRFGYLSNSTIYIYQGETLEQLERINNVYYQGVFFRPVRGQSYKIAIVNRSSSNIPDYRLNDPFRLEMHPFEPAANGDFADAIDLGSAESIRISGDIWGVDPEPEPDEPLHFRDGSYRNFSLWWKWTAPRTFTYSTLGSSSSLFGLFIYQGDSLAELREVTSRMFTADAEYYFAVAANDTELTESYSFSVGEAYDQLLENDDFADAIDLGRNAPVQSAGRFLQPTFEQTEPRQPQTWGSMWWRWTAPADGMYSFAVAGDGLDSLRLSTRVYTGNELGSLNPASYNIGSHSYTDLDGNGPIGRPCYFQANADDEFYLAVYDRTSHGPVENSIYIAIEHLPTASNDTFENAIELEDASWLEQSFTSPGAAWDEREPDGPKDNGTLLWWRWTAPETGTAVFNQSSDGRQIVRVHTGQDPASLAPVSLISGDSPIGYGLTFEADAGTEYWISIGRDRGAPIDSEDWSSVNDPWARSTFQLALAQPPVNDHLADAIDLGNDFAVESWSTSILATRDPDEPVGIERERPRTLWWTWTAPETRNYWISVDAGYDATCEVFSSGGDDSLLQRIPTGFREVGSSDSGILLRATSGVRYTIKAGVDAQIPVQLRIHEAFTFENDFFDEAIDLGRVFTALSTVTGINASAEIGEPEAPRGFEEGAIWWRWTAPGTGAYRIRNIAEGASNLEVYCGTQLADLKRAPVNSNESTLDSEFVAIVNAVAGEEYAFAWRPKYLVVDALRQVTLEIVPVDSDPFENWIARFPNLPIEQRTPEANPAGDGISNLQKFYFGFDPTRSIANPVDIFERFRLPSIHITNDWGRLSYRISSENVLNGSQGLYRDIVQRSVNGRDWVDQHEDSRLSSPQDNLQFWDIPHDIPQMYFRVKIELTR
ncbi:MAG: hypothetical protein KDN22_07795 [Verrucomicrobiae bacterium]|nr:hypothetical protein [Verrucomicrobiae bacterium]